MRARHALGGLLLGSACNVTHPVGSYEPEELASLDVVDEDAAAEDPYGEDQPGPFDDLYSGTDAGTGGGTDAGQDPQTPEQMLAAKLVGDYWMRTDTATSSSTLGITVRSDTSTYSVVKVGFSDGRLKLVDRQCFVSVSQDNNTTTTFRSEGQPAYAPAQRVLTLDPVRNTWTTGPCAYAVGWKWDFAKQDDRSPPTSDSDPLVYDVDGGGKGLNIAVKSGALVSCNLRVVQKVDVVYSGTLRDQKLVDGVMTNNRSQQNILAQDCTASSPTSRDLGTPTVKLVSRAVDASFACPALAEMRAAF